jgi:condensin complex subunit 1
MLFSLMFLAESKEKLDKSLSKKKETEVLDARTKCANAMLGAALAMAKNAGVLWKRGVADEAVVSLPSRIAYLMLESCTNVTQRKAGGEAALQMLGCAVDSNDGQLNTIVAALVDLMSTYDHVAGLAAELCGKAKETTLGNELLREIARLDANEVGIKNVAPFISELASVRPKVVLGNIPVILPLLESEVYVLRSAIVNSIGCILLRGVEEEKDASNAEEGSDRPAKMNSTNRSSLFDILCKRTRDVTSFTRGAALKVLNELTEKQSLPLDRVAPVTEIAIDRLRDKTVMVRRCAMQVSVMLSLCYNCKESEADTYVYFFQLLTSLLENNPYMGMLNPKPYQEKIRELEQHLQSNIPAEILQARDTALEETKKDQEGEATAERELQEIENAALAAAIADAEQKVENGEDLSPEEQEFLAKVRALKYASSALGFITLFENANASFQSMLLSSNSSDVTEALRFFVRAKHFGLPCAIFGTKRALALMWSNETSIQDEVLKAFIEVFVAEPGTDGKELLPENQIAQNFLDLVQEATASELASIEEALGRLVKKEIIPPEVFSILWQIASQAEGQLRASSMLVISMAASADAKIVDSAYRLQNLYDAGLGDYAEEHRDWNTVRSAANALQRVGRAKVDPSSARYIILDLITERLVAVARGDWCEEGDQADTNAWFSAAEQAINAIFTISPAPEQVASEILIGHQTAIFGTPETPCRSADSLRLSRFFFVLGHIALKLLIYTEVLSSSVRRANAAKTVKKQESASGKASAGKDGEEKNEEEDAIEAELGMAAQAEAETERKVAEISENEIVCRGLISLFTPMLLRVVANEDGSYSSPVLCKSSTLALCKCMCVSKTFCEKHLPLLFHVLEKAHDQDLRANIIVALGDLAFRFPNEVEPYTPKIYACLRDKSLRVRRHTLMVLTHLILNDMVKVKGQVCEIALCLQDQDSGIRDMARLLFHELSKRTNSPIYNLLPDIISQLSQLGLPQTIFREIMSFLLVFIKKDRQNEMLMEKLIQRFPKCTTINQKADLAYCIAQLKVNDKCIKCLNDSFKLYKDALFDEDVLKNFMTVLTKAKKNGKPESKDAIQELENKLNEHAADGMENVKANKKAQRAKARAAKRAQKKAEYEGESEGEESIPEIDEMDEENIPVNVVKSEPATKGSRRSGRSRSRVNA